jgi:hypothetical protein
LTKLARIVGEGGKVKIRQILNRLESDEKTQGDTQEKEEEAV